MTTYPKWTLSFNTEDAIDAAVSQHRQNIQDAQRRINELLSRRNALSLIGRLPSEVLGMVLLALVEAWIQHHYDEDFSMRRTGIPGCSWEWLTATCVCRHWRDVALLTPQLWAYIPLNVKNASSYFDRSGQVPLTIFHHFRQYTKPADMGAIKLLIENMWRVKDLCALLSSKCVEYAAAHGSLDAPILERVSAHVSSGHLEKLDEYAASDVIRRASWPRLHTFAALLASSTLLEAALQPALTSLTVELPQPRPSVEVWLRLLQNTPRLQSMHLTDAIEDSPPPALSVSLPYMGSLNLTQSGDFPSNGQDLLLSHIAIPPNATIVYYEGMVILDTAIFQVLALNARGGQNGLGIPRTAVQALDVSHHDYLQHLSFYTKDDTLAFEDISRPLRDPPDGDITVMLGQHGESVVGSLCEHYPLTALRRFRVSRDARVDADGWNALGQLPSLQVIEIAHGHTSAGLCYLPQALSVPQAFPALETLILNDIHWHPEVVDDYHYGLGATRADGVLVALRSALALRKEHSMPLRNLAILHVKKRGERWEEYDLVTNDLKDCVKQLFTSDDEEVADPEEDCSECYYSGSADGESDTESDHDFDPHFW